MLTDTVASAAGLRALVALLLCFLMTGCGSLYVAQAAHGQWRVMRERRPIEAVLADPATPAGLRARLEEVRAARDFATRELGLPDNGSYRTYADLQRPFVVWNVVATPQFSVEPRHWCFPIAGCVAYRGYFAERRARAFADAMRRRGFDTMVGGVPAYSTLGRFADPVLNTMMSFGDDELASIMFHELAHQIVYVPGDSAFNEAFAVAVEQAGLVRWLAFRGRSASLERFQTRRLRQMEFVRIFASRRDELARLYASGVGVAEMRARKSDILAHLGRDIRAVQERDRVRTPYAEWLEEGLNNAHLASLATYFDCVPGFERVLREAGGDLHAFYARARELARSTKAERNAALCDAPATPGAPAAPVTSP